MNRIKRSPIDRWAKWGAILLICAAHVAKGCAHAGAEEPAGERGAAPEPAGYRMERYQAPTPLTLRGARVVSTAEARRLWEAKAAIFIDAMPRAPKPQNLPPNTIWRDIPRYNIPGSVWLVDVGYGALSGERDRYFRDRLAALSQGSSGRPLLFYCKANCWMSWNAAKRALDEYGYKNVLWYPEGTDGWAAAGFDLAPAEPQP